jgi:hypothetical protein
LDVTVDNVLCYGGNNGVIHCSVTGGTAPYVCVFSTGDTTFTLTHATAGNYAVTVTDAHGCVASVAPIHLDQPLELHCSMQVTNVLCHGDSTGATNLTVNGGTTPYAVQWSTGQTSEDLSGLPAGTYIVTVTDANGCFDVMLAQVTQPAPITSTLDADSVTCFGFADGSISVSVTGGVAPFDFAWSDASADTNRVQLSAGMYSLTATDQNGCTHVDSAWVFEPDTLALMTSSTPDTSGMGVGTATVSVNGGTPPYSYAWSDALGQSTATAYHLHAGTYSITVADRNGCTVLEQVTVGAVVGLPSVDDGTIRVYPNPARTLLQVDYGTAQLDRLVITDVAGAMVSEIRDVRASSVTIDVTHLSAGVYFVSLWLDTGRVLCTPVAVTR